MTDIPNPPARHAIPWPTAAAVATLLLGAIVVGIYLARAPATPRQNPPVPAAAAATPAASPAPASAPRAAPAPATAAAAAPAKIPPTTGRLGVDKASCPSFAELSGRFWELKQRGSTIDSVFMAIEQGSAGDARKIKLLKALAQVVYTNATPTRELAYNSALEACRKD